MPSRDQFIEATSPFYVLASGDPGSGKTTGATSFPAFDMLCGGREPDILKNPALKANLDNLVNFDTLEVESDAELKDLFKDGGRLHDRLAKIKARATAGEIKTLIVDDATLLLDNLQQYIWKFKPSKSDKTGNPDTMAMWGQFGRDAAFLLDTQIRALCSRHQLNLVMTCHLKREDDEVVADKKLTTDLWPAVPGSLRHKLAGRFGESLYFEAKQVTKAGERSTKYVAYANPTMALGSKLLAKNSKGLPTELDLTGKSLYAELVKATSGVPAKGAGK